MINWRKSSSLISLLTKIDYFETSGKLFLWGAITSIIIVGAILLIASEIILVIAFICLPETV